MPVYEYCCRQCKKRFEKYYSYDQYGKEKPLCSFCQSSEVKRKIGRIRVTHSEESRLEKFESFANPSALEGLEEHPQELGRFMRKMGDEMGEDIGPEFDEVIDRLEKGQKPEEIEKELPEFGSPLNGIDSSGITNDI